MTQKATRRKQQKPLQDEVCLPVVQLGTTLRSENGSVDNFWAYTAEKRLTGLPGLKHAQGTSRYPKYKNMYEFSKRNKSIIPLHKGYWKIPGLSKNILVNHSDEGFAKKHLKERGMYETKFRDWYSRLVHENTVVLPPIKTSTRVREDVPDSTKLSEKNYISKQLLQPGSVKQFEQHELRFPYIDSKGTMCRECQRNNTGSVLGTYLPRSNKSPGYCKSPDMVGHVVEKDHCDVLGERYCKKCTEKQYKRFSKEIEQSLLSTSDTTCMHKITPSLHATI